MEQRLKEAVERIVRPIPLEESVKNRMREELWGHVRDNYASLRSEGYEEAAACDEALRRLGEPAAIRRELFRSQSLPNRIVGWLDFYTVFRPGIDAKKHVWRLVVLSLLGGMVFAVGSSITAQLAGRPGEASFLFVLGVELGVLYAAFVLVSAPLVQRLYRALRARPGVKAAAPAFAMYQAAFLVGTITLACAVTALGLGFFALLGSTSSPGWLFLLYVSPTLCMSLALILALAVPAAVALDTRLEKRLPDWPYDEPLPE